MRHLRNDEEVGGVYIASADEMSYNNASSGLTADDVQEAIDELATVERTSCNTYPLVIEKTVSPSYWVDFSFNVNRGDIVVVCGASTSTTGAFTVEITGTVTGAYTNKAINHNQVNNATTWHHCRALNNETITFKSYTNTGTTFKAVSANVTKKI